MPPPTVDDWPSSTVTSISTRSAAAFDTPRLGFHLVDVRQALQPLFGTRQRRVRQHRAFELAHLAAQDFVARALHAVEIDVPDIGARIRLDLKRERDLARLGDSDSAPRPPPRSQSRLRSGVRASAARVIAM